jgi:hypothetical protein
VSAERGRRRKDVRYVIISHSHASSVTHNTHTRGASMGVGPSRCQNYATRVSLSRPLGRLPAAPSTIPAAGLVDFGCHCVRSCARKRSQRAPHSHTLPRFAFCNTGMRSSLARLLNVPPPRLDLPDIFAEPTAPGSRTGRRHHGGPLPAQVFLSRTFFRYIGESSGDMTSP